MKPHRLVIPRRPRAWLAGAALLTLFASAPGLAARARALACTMLWGHSPTLECLWHAEFAKEGLAVDNAQRSFSVGYGQPGSNNVPKVAVLQVRDASGAKLSQNYYANGIFNAIYAGLFVPAGGARAFAVGTQFTGNSANPCQMIVSRWLPGSGIPWTNPVNNQTAAFTPAQLGLVGKEVWGCRIVSIGTTDLFVSGCTEFEIFLARIDRNTLSLILTWGIGGVQSVGSFNPNGCPQHNMPGGFVDFNFHRQSFVEVAGSTVYLGGTLLNDLPGIPIDDDYVVAGYDVATGAPLPFGVQYSRALKDDHMKALSANSFGVYAVGTSDPAGSPQLLLMAWRTDGSMRPPFYTYLPTPSRGNDVETRLAPPGCEIYVGGYDGTRGATWRFVHGTGFNSSVVKPALWKGASTGPNPKPYGPLAQITDEVYDIDIGIGTFSGHVFSAGAAQLGAGTYGQNLQCIAPNGVVSFSNNASPLALGDDRATAVLYHTSLGGSVFTHGTAFDPGSWLNCIGHWAYRSSRYQP